MFGVLPYSMSQLLISLSLCLELIVAIMVIIAKCKSLFYLLVDQTNRIFTSAASLPTTPGNLAHYTLISGKLF